MAQDVNHTVKASSARISILLYTTPWQQKLLAIAARASSFQHPQVGSVTSCDLTQQVMRRVLPYPSNKNKGVLVGGNSVPKFKRDILSTRMGFPIEGQTYGLSRLRVPPLFSSSSSQTPPPDLLRPFSQAKPAQHDQQPRQALP